jgi:hypothetical protein
MLLAFMSKPSSKSRKLLKDSLRFFLPHHNTHSGGGSEIGPLTFEKHTACARTPFKSAHLFNISCWWFSATAARGCLLSVVCETK